MTLADARVSYALCRCIHIGTAKEGGKSAEAECFCEGSFTILAQAFLHPQGDLGSFTWAAPGSSCKRSCLDMPVQTESCWAMAHLLPTPRGLWVAMAEARRAPLHSPVTPSPTSSSVWSGSQLCYLLAPYATRQLQSSFSWLISRHNTINKSLEL